MTHVTVNEKPVTATEKSPRRARRENGAGCLIPPRPRVSKFWSAQLLDKNGKQIRKSLKVPGELKRPDADPKLPESWTNITVARTKLGELIKEVKSGLVSVGHDPSRLYYADLRKLYLNDYTEQNRKSLRHVVDTDEPYVSGLNHLDDFFGYQKEGDQGSRVSTISVNTIAEFKAKRRSEGAENGTINRSLAALRRMFFLAKKHGLLQTLPVIEMLPEPRQPRGGFLKVEDYEKLYDTFGVEVRNEAISKTSRPYAYIQPLLQVGFYTGMRLGEIMKLTWSSVDLKDKVIRLARGTTKNDQGRSIPMIDGLPEMFEGLRRANPQAGENDRVFRGRNGKKEIGSFLKAWRVACIKAAIRTTLNYIEVVSHFSTGPECCPYCKGKSIGKGKYVGFVFHDLRRSAVRNLIRAGVNQTIAKKITGHLTDAIFERYDITSEGDLLDAATKVTQYLEEQRRLEPVRKTKLAVVNG